MKKIITILIFTIFNGIFAQFEKLDPIKYEAWSVEYIQYRLLVEKSIKDYLDLHPNDISNLPLFKRTDRIIIIRSNLNSDEIYQIWYGNDINYTVIDYERVKWIFGRTLRKTLVEKDKYFYSDAQFVFEGFKENHRGISYINNAYKWSNSDVFLSYGKIVTKLSTFSNAPGSSDFGLTYSLGNDDIGLPYRTMGNMKIGILNKYFAIGLRLPQLLTSLNGKIVEGDDNILNGSVGGYGAFHHSGINTEFGFSSLNEPIGNDPTIAVGDSSYINFINVYGNINYSIIIPPKVINPKYGTVILRPGFFYYSVAHRDIVGGVVNDRLTSPNGKIYDTPESHLKGVSLRVDAISRINKYGFPRFEITSQTLGIRNILGKLVFNITKSIGISGTVNYTNSNEIEEWESKNSVYFDINMKFDFAD
ncbi:hypothetical protein HOB87_15185 [Candidatus Woesearchaeota archaeon]|jgi:hypothetical protein|nr:hypothetical protein [Candidatus Neomarinimicrobiota bacterium]MBT4733288.1 hypothetical protein [Candidatus Woesearchaeota archaeon]MBT4684316.1 hypothetical protein [Candidatus Neomarinimicrobiota bacterium]MBT4733725.1 hypothetical protein [Candidatus Neomarinimicrobiota bacterium]MBT5069033.1 hypothetical protein [Candidatus Neomarinimicrobiota bacterium]